MTASCASSARPTTASRGPFHDRYLTSAAPSTATRPPSRAASRATANMTPRSVTACSVLPLPLGEGWGEGCVRAERSCSLAPLTLTLSQRERGLLLPQRLKQGPLDDSLNEIDLVAVQAH